LALLQEGDRLKVEQAAEVEQVVAVDRSADVVLGLVVRAKCDRDTSAA
jgi:hypothetical protein